MSGLLKTISQPVGAGSSTKFFLTASNFRLLEGSGVTVKFFANGSEAGVAEAVDSGFFLKARDALFDEIRIESPTAQTIKFTCGSGEAGAASAVSVSGTVTQQSANGAYAQTDALNVGVASAQLVAANGARRFLLIQNHDPATDVFLNLAGAAATLKGVKVAAGGGVVLLDVRLCTGQINAIAAAVITGQVCVVEG